MEEDFSLAPAEPDARNNSSRVVIGVLAALVLGALFVVSQRFDSQAHHYDTAAAHESLVTAAPGVTAPASTTVVTAAPPAVTASPTTQQAKFYASDSRIKAAFPTTPQRATQDFSIGAVSVSLTMYLGNTYDASYTVGTMPAASGVPIDLNSVLNGSAAGAGGQLQSSHATTFQRYPAVEGVITADSGIVHEIVIRAADRIVMLIVAGPVDPAAQYTAFRDSLEIL